jgi:hypothetical protein
MKANTHAFNVELATELGDVNEALILQHFYFWHQNNKNKIETIKEGHPYPWTYNTIEKFCEIFPYMKKGGLGGAIERLLKKELLISGNYNTLKFDKTKWYSLTEKGLILFESSVSSFKKSSSSNENSGSSNENSGSSNENSGSSNENTIPDSNTDSNTDNNTNSNKHIKSNDERLVDAIIEKYPGNVNSRKEILKVFKQLTSDEKKLAYTNLERYTKAWTGFYHNLRNYIEAKQFSDTELIKRETKNKPNNITNKKVGVKTFNTNYENI